MWLWVFYHLHLIFLVCFYHLMEAWSELWTLDILYSSVFLIPSISASACHSCLTWLSIIVCMNHFRLSVHRPPVHSSVSLFVLIISFFLLSFFLTFHVTCVILTQLPSFLNLLFIPPPLCLFDSPRCCSFLCSSSLHFDRRRAGEPAPPAGQRHAGCQRLVPADGGDGEAGGETSASGGQRSLLFIHQLTSAGGGERHTPLCRTLWKWHLGLF